MARGFLFALMTLAAGPLTAAAAPTVFAAGVYANFHSPGANGLVLVDQIAAHSARITTALGGLPPGHAYQLVFSKVGCGLPNTAARTLTKVGVGTVALDGSLFRTVLVSDNGGIWRETGSVRLMEDEGIYYCVAGHPVGLPATTSSDGAYARFADAGRRGLTVNTGDGNDQLTLRVALRGLVANTRYRLVHSPLTCRQFFEGNPDHPVVLTRFRSDSEGIAIKNRTETVDNNESITVGSYRVESVGQGVVWSCANNRLFAAI